MNEFVVLGHRGYRAKFAENTIEAFIKAREYGADGIEYDSRLTKDGTLVVLHDDTINNRKLQELTYEELKQIRFKNRQTIPTVEEVISNLDDQALLNLEIKEVEAAVPSYKITKRMNAVDRTLFSSFKIDALRKVRSLDKSAKVGLLIEYDTLKYVEELNMEINLYSLNLWINALKENIELSKELMHKWKEKGFKIFLWTVNDPEDLHTFKGLYDGIITDEVEKIVEERNKIAKEKL
ncbi:glycerophosphodiester phosphodiesterase family protein [Petrotoga olearia]|uniref:Glycerophosphoryl diester phosphodiesterase n=2 Tax=Petrotoga olearia TaxID=156203 RepID=A0A2K1P390_9BACT|nr:glycerophosphodiester phosphodiesterase family protein [Petrotoga olearia]PNR97253.1 glycerophosphoryl diester phosphodiesterase [Petrotoga olearia DSM 13574]RMA76707.1 glycerophosphoryl diester phosphodiesterase [Petrotoga olearia]